MGTQSMPGAPPGDGTGNGTKPSWAPILGQWEISDANQRFMGRGLDAAAHGQAFPMGLAISSDAMPNGICRVTIRFSEVFNDNVQTGGLVLGYRSPGQHYFFAQLGASRRAYSIGEYVGGFGWRPLVTTGQ